MGTSIRLDFSTFPPGHGMWKCQECRHCGNPERITTMTWKTLRVSHIPLQKPSVFAHYHISIFLCNQFVKVYADLVRKCMRLLTFNTTLRFCLNLGVHYNYTLSLKTQNNDEIIQVSCLSWNRTHLLKSLV